MKKGEPPERAKTARVTQQKKKHGRQRISRKDSLSKGLLGRKDDKAVGGKKGFSQSVDTPPTGSPGRPRHDGQGEVYFKM